MTIKDTVIGDRVKLTCDGNEYVIIAECGRHLQHRRAQPADDDSGLAITLHDTTGCVVSGVGFKKGTKT